MSKNIFFQTFEVWKSEVPEKNYKNVLPFKSSFSHFYFKTGSEHEINDKKFPLEAHLVHVSKITRQLAVLAFLFEVKIKKKKFFDFYI